MKKSKVGESQIVAIRTEEQGIRMPRAGQAARLARAAFCRPGLDRAAKNREALSAIVAAGQRWGFLEML